MPDSAGLTNVLPGDARSALSRPVETVQSGAPRPRGQPGRASEPSATDWERLVRRGDVVLDIKSGDGERCLAAARLAGDQGRVIGIDTDVRALRTARGRLEEHARTVAAGRVRFAKIDVRDLSEDLEATESYIERNPITGAESLEDFRVWRESQRDLAPALAGRSVDLVLAHSFQQLLRRDDRRRALQQLYWVLKPGGNLVLSDVISDEPIPPDLQDDRSLWNQRLIGTFVESELMRALRDAGFVGIRLIGWQEAPLRVVAGVEFRAATIHAVKPTGVECIDRGDAVIYRGPYAQVVDDEGHLFLRGERMAVCERTFAFLVTGPFREDFIGVPGPEGREPVPWCAPPGTKRSAQESKSAQKPPACGPGDGCC